MSSDFETNYKPGGEFEDAGELYARIVATYGKDSDEVRAFETVCREACITVKETP